MEADLKKNKKDCRAWFYLIQQNMIAGKNRQAFKCAKKYLKYSTFTGERWLVCYDCASLHLMLGHYLRATWWLAKAEKEIPGRWEVRHSLGLAYMRMERWNKALKCLVDSLEPAKGEYFFKPLKRDPAETWDMLGICFSSLGKMHEAKTAWKRAIELEAQKPEEQQKKQRFEILKRLVA